MIISAFKSLLPRLKSKYRLVLAGGSLGNRSHLSKLKESAKGFPIQFAINPDFNTLKNLYSKSKIYWHAAGYDVNEDQHPENVEHFGITVVEAMASGVVPVVVNKGGLKEIVDSTNGFLWNHPGELIQFTQDLIQDAKTLKEKSQKSINRATSFSLSSFSSQLLKIIKD